jgi:outer membrane protein assembly factor BamB
MNAKLLYGRIISATIVLLLSASAATAKDASQADPMDWPHWRGPEMNGISREKGIVESWSPSGENVLWQRDDLGSRSTPIVMKGRLYTICRDQPGTKKEGEKVVCLDAATGKTIWEQRFNVFLSDVPDTRVGWSSVVGDPETGRVFALGVCDVFLCMDGATGDVLWKHSLAEEYGALNTYGGRTNFPIVYDNLVIISSIVIGWGDMAKPAHRFIAFDIRNGQPVWYTGTRLLPYDTTYSSPVSTVLNGEAAIVFGSGDGGIHAFQPRTGKNIWTYNISRRGINTTPLVDGTTVYCGHSEENLKGSEMGALFAIDGAKSGDITETGEVWRNNEWMVGKSTPLLVGGRLYVIDDKATLFGVDPETGKQVFRKKLGTQQRSSMLYADGKIYVCTANGRWYTLKPTEDGVDVVHRDRLQDAEGNAYASHGSPVVSHGRLYIPTTLSLFCAGNKDVEPQADPRPEPPQETPLGEDQTPAQVQVVPVESLLKPGQEQDYQIRLYNKNGQFLKVVPPADVQTANSSRSSPPRTSSSRSRDPARSAKKEPTPFPTTATTPP